MDGRAQTSIDFAIGMAVFLVALTTVVAFMPTMTQPFTGGQETPLVADRLVAQLVDGHLGHPSEPSQIDSECTMFFFNGSDSPPDPCGAFDPTKDINTKLGVADTTFVNVTIRKTFSGDVDPKTTCATDGENAAEDLNEPSSGCASGEVLLADGPEPPTASGSITLARRMVILNDEHVFLVVRVWT